MAGEGTVWGMEDGDGGWRERVVPSLFLLMFKSTFILGGVWLDRGPERLQFALGSFR